MQCKRCGAEIPNGEVYCIRCGEEVQLVPDFNSVEYMMQQKAAAEEIKQRTEQEYMRQKVRAEKKAVELKRKRRRRIIWISILVLFLLSAAAVSTVFYIKYRMENSYDYQYQMGYEAYQIQDYETAKLYAERALELHPNSDNALLLLAETYLHMDETDVGVEFLMRYIELHPDSIEAYARIVNAYEEKNRKNDIRLLFEACNNDIILTEFTSYIPSEVIFVTSSGEYTEETFVELSFESGMVYYTIDGTEPGLDSAVYTEPILLEEGYTHIKAICYSQSGIPGEVVTADYTVTYAVPDAPFISPSSGEYEEGSQITVIVPEGCKAYYVFDDVATSSDTLYKGPVDMPSGEHIFSVIVVNEYNKQSYPVSETYVVG